MTTQKTTTALALGTAIHAAILTEPEDGFIEPTPARERAAPVALKAEGDFGGEPVAAKPARKRKPAKAAAKAQKPVKAAKAQKRAPKAATAAPSGDKAPTASSKVLGLLTRPEGASISDVQAATGWKPHTARAFISASVPKKGYTVTSSKGVAGDPDGVRIYRAAAAQPTA